MWGTVRNPHSRTRNSRLSWCDWEVAWWPTGWSLESTWQSRHLMAVAIGPFPLKYHTPYYFFLVTIHSGTLDTGSCIIDHIPCEGTGQAWWGGNLKGVGWKVCLLYDSILSYLWPYFFLSIALSLSLHLIFGLLDLILSGGFILFLEDTFHLIGIWSCGYYYKVQGWAHGKHMPDTYLPHVVHMHTPIRFDPFPCFYNWLEQLEHIKNSLQLAHPWHPQPFVLLHLSWSSRITL